MKLILASLLLSGFILSATAQIVTNQPARFKTKIILHEGKVGSEGGALDSAFDFAPEYTYPGKESPKTVLTVSNSTDELRLSWEFVGRNRDKDVYRFTVRRTTKTGVPGKVTTSATKEISFDGRQAVIFEDDLHIIIIESPSKKDLIDEMPKREPKPHA